MSSQPKELGSGPAAGLTGPPHVLGERRRTPMRPVIGGSLALLASGRGVEPDGWRARRGRRAVGSVGSRAEEGSWPAEGWRWRSGTGRGRPAACRWLQDGGVQADRRIGRAHPHRLERLRSAELPHLERQPGAGDLPRRRPVVRRRPVHRPDAQPLAAGLAADNHAGGLVRAVVGSGPDVRAPGPTAWAERCHRRPAAGNVRRWRGVDLPGRSPRGLPATRIARRRR
jgi:hypothetical protein